MSEANRVLSDAPLITEWPDGEGCTIYTDGGRVDVTWAELAGVLERPILFSTPLVRAILDGRKTVTRRPVKAVGLDFDVVDGVPMFMDHDGTWRRAPCPYGEPGDLLRVRESATVIDLAAGPSPDHMTIQYAADDTRRCVDWPERIKQPTIGHKLANGAYKEAARIWLRVTSVRVERLKDITEDEAKREGVTPSDAEGASNAWGGPHRWAFMRAWAGIYGKDTIAGASPWVWVVDFEVVSTTGRPAC